MTRNFIKKRRAVSQIIGSLLVLGIVTSVGSVLLFNGMKQINAFSYDLSFHDPIKNESYRESLIFEHVRFEPGTKDILLQIANTGTTDSQIVGISVLKIDTQELLLQEEINNFPIYAESSLPLPTLTVSSGVWIWDDTGYVDSKYKISVTTSKGNFFSTVATPFNT